MNTVENINRSQFVENNRSQQSSNTTSIFQRIKNCHLTPVTVFSSIILAIGLSLILVPLAGASPVLAALGIGLAIAGGIGLISGIIGIAIDVSEPQPQADLEPDPFTPRYRRKSDQYSMNDLSSKHKITFENYTDPDINFDLNIQLQTQTYFPRHTINEAQNKSELFSLGLGLLNTLCTIKSEGLFRISGTQSKINSVMRQINQSIQQQASQIQIKDVQLADVASITKKLLRDNMSDEDIKSFNEFNLPTHSIENDELATLLQTLSPNLQSLFSDLVRIDEKSTKMTLEGISSIFSPMLQQLEMTQLYHQRDKFLSILVLYSTIKDDNLLLDASSIDVEETRL